MSLGEVALEILGLFLLISPLGRLENLICETLESVAVPGLLLSLGMKNADVILETFKFTRHGLVLLLVLWQFHRIDRTVSFPLFVVALGRARLVCVT
jgi:hypothetical protein